MHESILPDHLAARHHERPSGFTAEAGIYWIARDIDPPGTSIRQRP